MFHYYFFEVFSFFGAGSPLLLLSSAAKVVSKYSFKALRALPLCEMEFFVSGVISAYLREKERLRFLHALFLIIHIISTCNCSVFVAIALFY